MTYSTTTTTFTNHRSIAYSLLAAATWSAAWAFTPNRQVLRSATTALQVATDPTTVTKKEYEDICGVSFGDDVLKNRLKATNYLYPKHVEVIEDIAPIAGAMVDDVVRGVKSLFLEHESIGNCVSPFTF